MRRVVLGHLVVDADRHEVWVGDRLVELTYSEFQLLYRLAFSAERVVERNQLERALGRVDAEMRGNRLCVHISRLRKKLRGSEPWQIRTVTKRGYAMVDAGAHRRRDGSGSVIAARVPLLGDAG